MVSLVYFGCIKGRMVLYGQNVYLQYSSSTRIDRWCITGLQYTGCFCGFAVVFFFMICTSIFGTALWGAVWITPAAFGLHCDLHQSYSDCIVECPVDLHQWHSDCMVDCILHWLRYGLQASLVPRLEEGWFVTFLAPTPLFTCIQVCDCWVSPVS
jgi:hypothetical protein